MFSSGITYRMEIKTEYFETKEITKFHEFFVNFSPVSWRQWKQYRGMLLERKSRIYHQTELRYRYVT